MTERKPGEILPVARGVVVDLAGFRLAQGSTNSSYSERCRHRNQVYDKLERSVWCKDCDRRIDAFDAYMVLTDGFAEMQAEASRLMTKAREAEDYSVVSRAAKVVDEVWRGRKMAPCCPHCTRGLLPEDFSTGIFRKVNREYELGQRARSEKPDG